MKINIQGIKFHLPWARCLIFSILLLLLPLISYSSQLIFTIQIGSYISLASAEKKFDLLTHRLDKDKLDYLRIEKLGKYYTLRLGKFGNHSAAKNFFKTVKPRLPKAIIRQTYLKNKKIIKLYTDSSGKKKKVKAKAPSGPGPDKMQPQVAGKSSEKLKDIALKEKTANRVKENTLSVHAPEKLQPQVAKESYENIKGMSLQEKIETVQALSDKKDFNSAEEILRGEITVQPEHPDLNAWLGAVLLNMDQPLEAMKYFKKAAELAPKAPDFHNGIGYCLFFLNRFDKAINAFKKAISLDPEHLDALIGLCLSYAKSGKKESALDVYNNLEGLDKETSDNILKIIKMSS
jgi:tetratricopeptide (TPR) repeat protein